MSEQAKILAELQEIIMSILTSGAASAEQGQRIDTLEALLHQQKCYKKSDADEYGYQGEEIAGLLLGTQYTEAIDKMCKYEITPEDFFGFIEYHDEEEEFTEVYTDAVIEKISNLYQSKCSSSQ